MRESISASELHVMDFLSQRPSSAVYSEAVHAAETATDRLL